MAQQQDPRQHRFALNNGSGEIPALGFGTLVSDRNKTRDATRIAVEQGFEVAVVKDATAGPRLPEGDGYLSALVNFRFLASAVWTTAEAVALLTGSGR